MRNYGSLQHGALIWPRCALVRFLLKVSMPSQNIVRSVSDLGRVAKPVVPVKLHEASDIAKHPAGERSFPTCFPSLDLPRCEAPEEPLDYCTLRENAKKKQGCGLNETEWDLLNNITAFDVLMQYVIHTYMSENVRAR